MTKSTEQHYATWPTAWGPMGGVWGADGLERIVLPHYQPDELTALLAWEHPKAVKDDRPFEALISRCRDYFNRKSVDFLDIPCRMPAEGTLAERVYRQCRLIPPGQTRSYTQLATLIGQPDSARAVASALGRNNVPLVIPCHRVRYADGKLGGFSAPGGVQVKQRLLELEKSATPFVNGQP